MNCKARNYMHLRAYICKTYGDNIHGGRELTAHIDTILVVNWLARSEFFTNILLGKFGRFLDKPYLSLLVGPVCQCFIVNYWHQMYCIHIDNYPFTISQQENRSHSFDLFIHTLRFKSVRQMSNLRELIGTEKITSWISSHIFQ